MDDTLWSLALALGCHMKEVRKPAARNWTHDERAMFHLLEGGLFDARAQDKPWDTSTQSMRYTTVMGDRLWSMYETERARVGVSYKFSFLVRELIETQGDRLKRDMWDVSAKMDALYQRMQELHNGAVAQDAYVDGELDTQHQRLDHHQGKLNFLACDRVELVDLELLRLCGENNKMKAKVVSMVEHLCRCSQL